MIIKNYHSVFAFVHRLNFNGYFFDFDSRIGIFIGRWLSNFINTSIGHSWKNSQHKICFTWKTRTKQKKSVRLLLFKLMFWIFRFSNILELYTFPCSRSQWVVNHFFFWKTFHITDVWVFYLNNLHIYFKFFFVKITLI